MVRYDLPLVWSHTGCLASPSHLACALMTLPGGFALWSSHAQKWNSSACNSMILSPFLKNGSTVSIFPVIGDFIWQPWLLKYGEESLRNYISQFPQVPGIQTFGWKRMQISGKPVTARVYIHYFYHSLIAIAVRVYLGL